MLDVIDKPVRLALLGAPNCGKTSLFNALTGGRAKVANYPGVTVEYRKGLFSTLKGQSVELLDLPGVYGDCGHSMDERVTIGALRGELDGEPVPDGIIFVLDASHINTHLHSVLQAKNYGLPITLVLNMMDMSARDGIDIDVAELENKLGMPVIPCVAVRSSGRALLLDHINKWSFRLGKGMGLNPKAETGDLKILQLKAREIASHVVTKSKKIETLTDKIDKIVLHPVLGLLLLISILFLMFQAVYTWSGPLIDGIDGGFGAIGGWVDAALPDSWLKSLLVDGVIAGVGAVLVFIPQIVILFAFILALEASGYMARAAFLVDTLMAKIGLNGRAFIPLLSSFACAIPGIMASRSIEQERDRLATILIAPLMTCSARWPVYFLVIGALIPNTKISGFSLQGLVAFGLVVAGVLFALVAAYILKRTLLKGRKSTLLLELPSYKLPVFRDYILGLWERAMIFVTRAGRVILPATIILWFLARYPNGQDGIEHSFAGMIGRVLHPIFAPIGFNLEMVVSLIPAMAAREVAVSSLGTIYALQEAEVDTQLSSIISSNWTLAMGLAFLAWFVFAPQCLSTLAVMRKETNGWKWPIFAFTYMTVLAYLAAGVTYWLARAAGL